DFERRGHPLAQPSRERLQMATGLLLVDLPRARAGRRGELAGARIQAERAPEVIVDVDQPEEDLVRLLVIGEWRRVVRLDEVHVEVARRLRGRALVGRSEKEVATTGRPALAPLDLVLPDVVAGNVLWRGRVLKDNLFE